MSTPAKTWQEWAADTSIDFWDCIDDQQELTHEALEEAVESYVDDGSGLPEDVVAWVRNYFLNGLEVYGWRRKAVDQKWLRNEAERLAERFFEESWDEEYGDPHERPRAAEANLATAFVEAMRENLPEPWQCERVVTVTIPLDELLALLRECRPEWFEVTSGRDAACVERWPECRTGAFDPRCCRFPKSCSCEVTS